MSIWLPKTENSDWGYERIVGAMATLGYRLSDQTVGNILQRHGIPPAPERKRTTTWADFIRAHGGHETGACAPCSAAKGHHDPGPFGQTRPDSAGDEVPAADINHPYHMGDLVNIDVKNGKGSMMHTTDRITLSPGRLSILDADGSAFIIHTHEDTYCDEESDLKKGCAGGARDACGIIIAD